MGASKFYVALAFAMAIAALTAAETALGDGVISLEEGATIALAFLSAGFVWLVPNRTPPE